MILVEPLKDRWKNECSTRFRDFVPFFTHENYSPLFEQEAVRHPGKPLREPATSRRSDPQRRGDTGHEPRFRQGPDRRHDGSDHFRGDETRTVAAGFGLAQDHRQRTTGLARWLR